MRLLSALFVAFCAASAYVASPIVAAWTVREAVRAGDVATLERKIEWPAVRASLKQSLRTEAETVAIMQAEANGLAKPTLWQRLKNKVTAGMVDRFVDATFTPKGLVRAYALRPAASTSNAEEAKESLPQRIIAFLSRISRLQHPQFGKFVVEVEDRDVAGRYFVGHLELQGLEWRLVDLAVTTRHNETDRTPAVSPLITSVR